MKIPEFGRRFAGKVYIDRPGVYALIENDQKQIAVIETPNGSFLPGGGIEANETDVEALKRETLEETGYQISAWTEAGQAIEYMEARTDGKHYRIHSKFYKVRLGTKIGDGLEKDERLVWLPQKEALKRLVRRSQVWAIRNVSKNIMER